MEADMKKETASRRKEEDELRKRKLASDKKTDFVMKFFPSFRNTNGDFRREDQDHDRNGSMENSTYQAGSDKFRREEKSSNIFTFVSGQTTPKRKIANLQVTKKRKISPKFCENLTFWENTITHNMPTNSALRKNSNINFNGPAGLAEDQCDVKQRDSPRKNLNLNNGPIS